MVEDGVSGQVLEPKDFPLSSGGCLMQGPVDEADGAVQLNMELFGSENRFGSRHFSSSKSDMKEESRTSNMCATPCSTSMHSEQLASPMKMTADDEFPGEAYKGKAASLWFSIDGDTLSPSISSACNDSHHTSSEPSNLLSACSSHDSISENAEYKAILRASNTSKDIGILVKIDAGEIVAKKSKAPFFHDSQMSSSQLVKQKESECLGDNISCVIGSDCMNRMASNRNVDTDRKDVSCSSTSVNSFLAVERAINNPPASCFLASSHFGEMDNNHCRWPNKFTKESSQAIVICSNKSDLSEISSLRDFCASGSCPKVEPSDCSDEQVESSLTKAATSRMHNQKNDVCSYAESMKSNTEMDKGDLAAEAAKCSDEKEKFDKACSVVEEPNMGQPSLQPQHLNDCDESDTMEYDVKVCDICGDAGREDLLAICSKCIDGAEHTYCMHDKLEKVPEGDWMCEECMLEEKTEKDKKNKFEKASRALEESSLIGRGKNSSAFNYKNSLELDIKGSYVEKRKANKVGSTPLSPSKRPASSLEAISVTKRRAFETNVKSRVSTPCSKTLIRRESSFKNIDKGKTKPYGNCTSNNTPENERLRMISDKSRRSQSQFQMPRGSLLKSKSFNVIDSKVRGQLSEECGVKKKIFARETAISDSKKEGAARMMCKSTSFNYASSGPSKAADSKVQMLSSASPHFRDLKRLRHAKEHNSVITKHTSTLCNPLVSSPVADPGVSLSNNDKKIAHRGGTVLSRSSGSNHSDLKAAQGHEKSSNSSKSTSCLAHKGFSNEEQNRMVDDLKQHVVRTKEVALAVEANHSNDTAPSDGRPYLRDLPWLASAVTIPSWISVVPQLDYIWQGGFEIQRSGKLPSSFDGIQAHLSTYASPKVLEVVHRLPQKILLEGVSRLSMWPTQFLENHATEDNIALYFFAKDQKSYGRHYLRLLEFMIKNDIGLKGNFDGVELLIFSSNLLPEQSQRWNKLSFLWGVFKGRRANCSENLPSSLRKNCISTLDVPLPDQNLSDSAFSGRQNLHHSGQSSLSDSNISNNAQQTSNSVTLLELPHVTSGTIVEIYESKFSPPKQKFIGLQTKLGKKLDAPMQSNEREERVSMRRQEIDLNYCIPDSSECDIDLNHCIPESSECNADSVRVDEERERKRMKSCLGGMHECNSTRDTKSSNDVFPYAMGGLTSSLSGKANGCDAAYDMSKFPEYSVSGDGRMGVKPMQQPLPLFHSKDRSESWLPNLELSLRTESNSSKDLDKPYEFLTNNNNNDEKLSMSLDLSIGCPLSENKQLPKP